MYSNSTTALIQRLIHQPLQDINKTASSRAWPAIGNISLMAFALLRRFYHSSSYSLAILLWIFSPSVRPTDCVKMSHTINLLPSDRPFVTVFLISNKAARQMLKPSTHIKRFITISRQLNVDPVCRKSLISGLFW